MSDYLIKFYGLGVILVRFLNDKDVQKALKSIDCSASEIIYNEEYAYVLSNSGHEVSKLEASMANGDEEFDDLVKTVDILGSVIFKSRIDLLKSEMKKFIN